MGTEPIDIVVLLPVYDDWESLEILIGRLEAVLESHSLRRSYLIVDDGSVARAPQGLASAVASGTPVRCVRLRRNIGHQRAIAIGLTYVHEHIPCGAVLVMDADGEDRPEDVSSLWQRFKEGGGRAVVFAGRLRRSESLAFRVGYAAYRLLHRLLTGIPVKVGNFSIVSSAHLETLVVVSDLWNHYAAAVVKVRIPYEIVPTTRGQRLAGASSMHLASLMAHGLSAISVFADVVGTRLIVGVIALSACLLLLIGVVFGVRLGTGHAIPGWATYSTGLLLILLAQALTLACSLAFFTVAARSNLSFLPIRDYRYFVGDVVDVAPRS